MQSMASSRFQFCLCACRNKTRKADTFAHTIIFSLTFIRQIQVRVSTYNYQPSDWAED